MKATNGPAEYFYEYVVDVDIPYLPNRIAHNVGDCAKERLRSHLYAIYLGRKAQTVVAVRHFMDSFEAHNEASEIGSSGGRLLQAMEAEDFVRMREFRKLALKEAEKVDIEILDERLDGFGDHYRDQFIGGMRKLVEGYALSEDGMLLEADMKLFEGYRLMKLWGDWYTAREDEIWEKAR